MVADDMSGTDGLAALEARLRHELAMLDYPTIEWVPPRLGGDGRRVLDVAIVGGGQGGLAAAFALLRERVPNILVIDKAPAGREGPWLDYARMLTLRSPKATTGPDLGFPSLAFQAWYEAQHGPAAWQALNKIPTGDWAAYLQWYRRVLAIPVRNETELTRLGPTADGYLRLDLADGGHLVARKVILTAGIESTGRWWMPEAVEALPRHLRAHSCAPIDFAALAGKRVAVLGAGAAAFDNAATALEAGAARVDLFHHRPELQRVQPFRWMSNCGFMRHLSALDDAWRWRFMNHILEMGEGCPKETWERVTRHPNVCIHLGSPWDGLDMVDGGVRIATPCGVHHADFLIAGTGLDVDLACDPILAPFAGRIATWADRHRPPPGEENPRLARYPYLGPGLSLTEKARGTAPFLNDIHLFTWASTLSFGPSGASINGMKFAIPKLVWGITRDLFADDVEAHYRSLLDFQVPEFEIEAEQAARVLAG